MGSNGQLGADGQPVTYMDGKFEINLKQSDLWAPMLRN